MMVDIKGAQRLTYKHVGYFPTIDANTILPLLDDNEEARLVELKGERKRKETSKKSKPIPCVEYVKENRDILSINYNFVKHGDIEIDKLLEIINDHLDTVIIERMAIHLDNNIIFPAGREEHNNNSAVAVFESHYEKPPKNEEEKKNNQYVQRLERHITKEQFEDGFKHTSLDTCALQNARAWMNNDRRGFYKGKKYGSKGILTDVEVVRKIMKTIDKNKRIGSIRNLNKGAKDAWIYDGEVGY